MNLSGDTAWNSTDVEYPFLFTPVPGYEHIIPNHNVTSDGWVVSNSTLFNTQWIDCNYPTSGGYGRTPRYIFYFLVLFSVLERRRSWLAGIALASVMTYSSTAAVHALALVVGRTRMISQSGPNNYERVLVGGSTTDGMWVSSTSDNWQKNGLWLPVVPMVWDSDIDAVLAIVGVSFLVITPMQVYSTTFQKSEAKNVLLLWSLLLLMGMACSLVMEAYFSTVRVPQLRFCHLTSNDTLPIANSRSRPATITWNPDDIYQANRTITDYFASSTVGPTSSCIYSCFGYLFSLRDPTDIVARRLNLH
jgi:type II secretory pathway pseudopilin PulG